MGNSSWPWLPMLSLVVAGMAVFFGPLIQLYIAKNQIRATVLSANRQRWIDGLRELIAEFTTVVSELNVLSKMRALGGQAAVDKTRHMHLCLTKITLMLNPREEDHQQLLALMRVAAEGISKPPDEDKTDIPAVIAVSQNILKREWERVRAAE